MSRYAPREQSDVARFIGEEVLGILTTCDADGFVATPLPLLLECDGDGHPHALVGHFARANPHVERARRTSAAQVTFLGPHGYIPTSLVSQEGWAPTWNYRFVQLEVRLTLDTAENDAAIQALVRHMEGTGVGSWSTERVGARYDRLVANVVAFRASVIRSTARFKLGQDEDRRTFDEIVRGLGDGPLARAMLEQRQD